MILSDFDYHLPQERIAQTPLATRDHSRLLCVNRATQEITHHHFYDLPNLLTENDVLVMNNSKTIPARVFAHKITGGKLELLFLKCLDQSENSETWEVLSTPAIKPLQTVIFDQTEISATCTEDHGYTKHLRVDTQSESVLQLLHRIGTMPTPHYIKEKLQDQERYQTIYAKFDGSAATPTAGLHFTTELLEKLHQKKIETIELTLHVGLGTFLPVKVEDITKHAMHQEWYELTNEQAKRINQAKKSGKRIVAVGTTSVRTLETCANPDGTVRAETGSTSIFIYPPYTFKTVDAMITNFHLPKSTLLMLISAFATEKGEFSTFQDSLVGKAYLEAIAQEYRFFSFGDAMLIE
ncbi:MAG: S-adenosylmethionine:tRNA ribosyltransferase-isomerase [Microgenomates group bacterium GW2011_GWF2_45_18]|nr:MAG: S-adenosylmethionine:tRNA ribosyltransferase-isomerase [Microgenomates group bacterium GW2011_GWF1_44_10]KKU01792.1 MAG: S-adenosylmethionine:tRNA ribosyltransferase-isomerase [Microgenomates group bacterium GW2011_GWF2_45_18]HAU98904.1 tRNA preQ1(34) S-adenosylmethionine ribosyltransferase-isomerase QueA [Candidatus Paceibacterota bacterium]HAX01139.1 tRNA preQ1(34) S-adenosylmethionine ribosyltransferase-isomerase QueA [Candidatus Paceibacterota bacterium]